MTRVLYFPLGELPREVTLTPDARGSCLKAMQGLVDGYVECLNIGEGLDLWCNEEGLLRELPINPALGPRLPIRGAFFVARHDGQGNTTSLTDTDIAQLTATFDAERLIEEGAA